MAQCFELRIAVIFAKYSYAYLYPPRPPLKSGSLKFQAQTISLFWEEKPVDKGAEELRKGWGEGEVDGSVMSCVSPLHAP